MRMPGLYVRALGAGAIAVVACVLLMLGFGGTVFWGGVRRMADLMQPIDEQQLARDCEADPHHYLWDNGRGLRAWPVDPQTLEPWQDGVIDVPPTLALRLQLGEERPVALGDGETWGGAMLIRRPEAPACQVVLAVWDPQPDLRRSFQSRLLLLLLVVASIALLATGLLVLRPLFRSIRALDAASRDVGTPAYTGSLKVDPSLDAVVTALDDAHARILDEHTRLEANNRALERHLADVAHDLRTPLAALQLRLEQLSVHGLSAEGVASDALRGALQDVTTLGLLTENLALASQLDAGALPRPAAGEVVDLGAVVDRIGDRFRALGQQVGIDVVHVRPDPPVWVRAATVHLEQLLANLVNNALTSNGPGGHVAIVLTCDDDQFTLAVEDDGPGIPPDLRAEVLHRGVRKRSEHPEGAAAGETPGEGLGLSIVVQLTQHLGWSFTLEDPPSDSGLVAAIRGQIEPDPT